MQEIIRIHDEITVHPFRKERSLKNFKSYRKLLYEISDELNKELIKFNEKEGVKQRIEGVWCHTFNASISNMEFTIKYNAGDYLIPLTFIESVISQIHFYIDHKTFYKLSTHLGAKYVHDSIIYSPKHKRWFTFYETHEALVKTRDYWSNYFKNKHMDTEKLDEEFRTIEKYFLVGDEIIYE